MVQIRVLSYNVAWQQIMQNKIFPNIQENILNAIDFYQPSICCFQEAFHPTKILKCIPNSWFYIYNKSGKEEMLTCYDPSLYTLVQYFDSEFERGRPFIVCIFEIKSSHQQFVLVNLHASHEENIQKALLDPLTNFMIQHSIDPLLDQIYVGDFNREFSRHKTPTCCSTRGYHTFDFDYVLSNKPVQRKVLGRESWYKYPSSDHSIIIGIVKI